MNLSEIATLGLFAFITGTVFWLLRRRYAKPSSPLETDVGLFAAPALGRWNPVFANVLPVSQARRQRIEKELGLAGAHQGSAIEDFLAKRNLASLGVFFTAGTGFAAGLADDHELIYVSAVVVVGSLTYCIPRILLSGQANRRKQKLEKSIPDVIDMIAMSIDGGVPLTTAIGDVESRCRGLFPELASELRIVRRQADSGDAPDAFSRFAKRIEMPEVAAWCAMMRQSQNLGGQLGNSLRDYASRLRSDRQNRVERAGNTASLKLLLPVVLCLAPPIAVLLVGPAVIEFRDFINRNKDATESVFEQVQAANESSTMLVE
ncbi:type II secretion system F family protein [Roseiconus lacunae]|uniref:type II secretion system F family protein n=1 Tax=Roseiconus lacunae TaxID=2605694 RepID=UPI0011F2E310|nr:type II secretion system F family protein [Roseiconus lacunae]